MREQAVLWMQNPIFAAAGEEVCEELAGRYPARLLDKGAEIVPSGSPADHLHVLLSGTVRVFHRTPDGREAVVKLLRAPMVFGDIELLQGLSFLESVATVEQSDLALVPAEEYLSFLEENPKAMMQHLHHLAGAFCVAALREHQVFANIEQRVANLLLSYADLYGSPGGEATGGEVVVAHELSQNDIAQSLGSVRRSVAQVISNWSKAGVVTKRQNRFVLLKPDKLEELARSIRGSLCYQMGRPLTIKAPSQEVSQAVLEVVDGPEVDRGRVITFEKEILVGRQPPCALVLSDTNVSRIHCRVFKGSTGGRFWVEDLDSTNGTLVNDKKIRRAVLHDGHVLQLGACCMDFHVKQPTGGEPGPA